MKFSRIKQFFGPVLAGALVDAVDLATFGPIGLSLGLLAGGVVGWWLGPMLGLARDRRWLGGLLSGLYCMTPFTSVLPLASLSALLARLFKYTDAEGTPSEPAEPGRGDALDVDFKVVTDENESNWPGSSHSDTIRGK